MENAEGCWHLEQNDTHYPGQRFQLLQEKIVCERQSNFQSIKVFEHKKFGTVLTLDGCVQCTTFDEFLYQEMLTFLPLCSVSAPSNVLVIGGGDGGIVRELLKDSRVERITLVDIDEEVLNTSKEFIKSMGDSLDDGKVNILICDASVYVQSCSETFDVIIIDLVDDGEEDESPMNFDIFGKEFYGKLRELIKDGGVLAQQTYSPYSNDKLLAAEVELFRCAADQLCYGFVPVPSFPNGNIGILFGRVVKDGETTGTQLRTPSYVITADRAKEMNLRCYYDEFHESCCTLPLAFRDWFYNL